MTTVLPDPELATWVNITEQFLTEQAAAAVPNVTIQLDISAPLQTIVDVAAGTRLLLFRRSRRLQQQQQQALDIAFTLTALQNSNTDTVSLKDWWESAWDTEVERRLYLELLQNALPDYFGGVDAVQALVGLEEGDVTTTTPRIEDVNNSSSASAGPNAGLVAGVVVAVALTVVVLGLFVWRRRTIAKSRGALSSESSPPSSLQNEVFSGEPLPILSPSEQRHQLREQQQYTNELVWTPNFDEISTLSGKQHTTTASRVYDDPTATVDLDNIMDYKQPAADTVDEGTALSKLGLYDATDETSFEELFARDILENVTDDSAKIKPFVLKAEPGSKLGMVVETNGGIPSVRAIRSDSPFVNQVQVGDYIIGVNDQDVTNMTAVEVSELIACQQFTDRKLVFVRPDKRLEFGFNQADF